MSSVFKAVGNIFKTGSSAAERAANQAQAQSAAQFAQTEASRKEAEAKARQIAAEANAIQAEQLGRASEANRIQQEMLAQTQAAQNAAMARQIASDNLLKQPDPLENIVEVIPGGTAAEAGAPDVRSRRRRPGLAAQLGLQI